jgi:hypothetical protein
MLVCFQDCTSRWLWLFDLIVLGSVSESFEMKNVVLSDELEQHSTF